MALAPIPPHRFVRSAPRPREAGETRSPPTLPPDAFAPHRAASDYLLGSGSPELDGFEHVLGSANPYALGGADRDAYFRDVQAALEPLRRRPALYAQAYAMFDRRLGGQLGGDDFNEADQAVLESMHGAGISLSGFPRERLERLVYGATQHHDGDRTDGTWGPAECAQYGLRALLGKPGVTPESVGETVTSLYPRDASGRLPIEANRFIDFAAAPHDLLRQLPPSTLQYLSRGNDGKNGKNDALSDGIVTNVNLSLPVGPLSFARTTTGKPDRFMMMGGNIAGMNQVLGKAATRHLTERDDFAVTGDVNHLPTVGGDAVKSVMVTSIAQLQADLAAGKLKGVSTVIYDIEGWDATPAAEKEHPAIAMRRFAELAHANGLKVVTIPYPDIAKAGGLQPGESMYQAFYRKNLIGTAAKYSDYVSIQAQQLELHPEAYRNFTAALAQQARAANPNVVFMGELTGSPEGHLPSAHQLRMAYNSVSDVVDGFYISAGKDKEQLAKFLAGLP